MGGRNVFSGFGLPRDESISTEPGLHSPGAEENKILSYLPAVTSVFNGFKKGKLNFMDDSE